MFTGIVESIGTVQAIRKKGRAIRLQIRGGNLIQTLKIGDSVSTNGVCLTVSDLDQTTYYADVMPETMQRTNLGQLTVGSRVNLESALTLSKPLGGHLVSGHIDGIGTISRLIKVDNAVLMTVSAKAEIIKSMIEKGSVAIDGISLTVVGVGRQDFVVSIIPTTLEETILGQKKIGDSLNLECDLIGKYLEKRSNDKQGITLALLRENGFA